MTENQRIGLATISTELPRKCGIATFNHHLLKGVYEDNRVKVHRRYSIVKEPLEYAVGEKDRIREINQNNNVSWGKVLQDISQEAQHWRDAGSDLGVIIQFEYGIFRDKNGRDFSVNLVKGLRQRNIKNILIPHTILDNPDEYGPNYKPIMQELVKSTDQIICLTPSAIDLLEDVYGAPREITKFIPHGINKPTRRFNRDELKKEFGLEGRVVELIGGFFSDGKDFKTVLKTQARIKQDKKYNIITIIPGITHPDIKERAGESYRESMINLARKQGLSVLDLRNSQSLDVLKQHDLKKYDAAFLDLFSDDNDSEKLNTLSDVRKVPNNGKSQISSGEIAKGLEGGRIVLATENYYSRDLAKISGVFTVKHGDSESWYDCENFVLSRNPQEKRELERASATVASTMYWRDKSRDIINLFETLIHYG